jgi:hypothetical protein
MHTSSSSSTFSSIASEFYYLSSSLEIMHTASSSSSSTFSAIASEFYYLSSS